MRLYRRLLHLEIDLLGYHGRSSIHVLSSGPMLLNLFDPTAVCADNEKQQVFCMLTWNAAVHLLTRPSRAVACLYKGNYG
jgi:hypothetical protein